MAKIDLEAIKQRGNKKLIGTQKHPQFDLLIHNYSKSCQYERAWDDITTQCRGLITDLEGNIVSRPFRKFFNVGENNTTFENLPLDDFEVTRKMDGSLGISYQVDGSCHIATRGSFISEQSQEANKILRARYNHYQFDPGLTYLWEIIYPQNKIVVDYSDLRDIVLLEVTETETGKSTGRGKVEKIGQDIGCPVVDALEVSRDGLAGYRKLNLPNSEGVVIKFKATDERYKIKFEEYLRLHRLVTQVNAKTIWELMSTGKTLDELLDKVPDEFYNWVDFTFKDLRGKYSSIESQAKEIFSQVGKRESRKDYAMEFAKHKDYTPILFSMLDGKPYSQIIWKTVRPEATKPFKVEV